MKKSSGSWPSFMLELTCRSMVYSARTTGLVRDFVVLGDQLLLGLLPVSTGSSLVFVLECQDGSRLFCQQVPSGVEVLHTSDRS